MARDFIVLFLLGTALGSFLNVIASRYRVGLPLFARPSVSGRSHCEACQKTLSWYELIPLMSFIIQMGRCRSCKSRLSLQYPIVEISAGLSCALVPLAVGRAYQVDLYRLAGGFPGWYYWLSGLFVLAVLTLILISAIDYRLKIIPDQSNLLIGFLGLAAILVKNHYQLFGDLTGSFLRYQALIFGLRENIWINHLGAALAGILFLGAIVILSRGRGMGLGDVKLAGALGLLLGWPDAALALMLAFIVGALGSIILMWQGRKKLKSAIPFGPSIVIGACLIIFLGKEILDGYFLIFPNP